MNDRRFLVGADRIEPGVSPGSCGRAVIEGAEHHHLSRVLRLREGIEISVFDGEGRGFFGRIESIRREATTVTLDRPDDRPVEAVSRITLLQGIPHHEKMEWIVQKATELGVARIVPIVADRSVVRPREGAWPRLERWRRAAAEAARQSGRRVVPRVTEPVPLAEALSTDTGAACEGWLLSLAPAAPGRGDGPGRPVAPAGFTAMVAVGPEGGFTEAEERLGIERGLRAVSLGPRTLRAETAGIVAVALALHLAGDLGAGLVPDSHDPSAEGA